MHRHVDQVTCGIFHIFKEGVGPRQSMAQRPLMMNTNVGLGFCLSRRRPYLPLSGARLAGRECFQAPGGPLGPAGHMLRGQLVGSPFSFCALMLKLTVFL